MSSFVPHTAQDLEHMLEVIGVSRAQELFADIPQAIREPDMGLEPGISEMEALRRVETLARQNNVGGPCFLGAGAYRHHIPALVPQLMSRSEFLTAYTPYQPEMSQGLLQGIFEYQTLMCAITGLDASNASVYDGATAAAEAMSMCMQQTRRTRFLLLGAIHPQTVQVVRTYARFRRWEVVHIPAKDGRVDMIALNAILDNTFAGVLIAQPNALGLIEDIQEVARIAHQHGALAVAACNPIALSVLQDPGQAGIDIAVGEGQPLGNPVAMGGAFGFMAAKESLLRRLPGRIVGQTADAEGNPAFVLTLQAREQHIRREQASSNICSNQALNALAGAMYLTAIGPEGFEQVGRSCVINAHHLARRIAEIPGMRLKYDAPFFHEFVVQSDIDPLCIREHLRARGIIGGLPLGDWDAALSDCTLYCATEVNTMDQMDALVEALKEVRP